MVCLDGAQVSCGCCGDESRCRQMAGKLRIHAQELQFSECLVGASTHEFSISILGGRCYYYLPCADEGAVAQRG